MVGHEALDRDQVPQLEDDRALLLRLHPCAEGLDDEAIAEIAGEAKLIRCEPGSVLCRPGETVTAVYLIVHGRLRLELLDPHGRVVVRRFQGSGGQVGGIAAATAEPQPLLCTAEDVSTLLAFSSETVLALSRKHGIFRENWARLMAQSVRQTLLQDKSPLPLRISAFFHGCEQTRQMSRAVLQRLVQLGEAPHVFVDRPVDAGGVDVRLIPIDGHEFDPIAIRRQSAEWLKSGRLVFDVDMGIEPAAAARAVEACDQVFWCVTPATWKDAVGPLRSLQQHPSSFRHKISVVWLLAAGELTPVADELNNLAASEVKVSVGQPTVDQGPLAFRGVERLVHLLRGLRVGVALGGGAARGMAHLGVLKALEEGGVTVDMIAGTSAGAMTGTIYAAGFSSQFMIDRFADDLRPPWWFRCLPRGEQWHLLYRYRWGHFDRMLRRYLCDARLEQLHIPMHTVAVDLISGRDVVRSRGDAVKGILESINLPPLATPIHRDGQALVDGGLINNVPANVLAARGCNFIIAVSVTAKMELEFAQNRADTPVERMRRASTIQTLLRSYLVQGHSVNAVGIQSADFVIEPDVTRFELSAFTKTAELAAVGEQEAITAVPKIRALLNRLDPQLYPELPNDPVDGLQGNHDARRANYEGRQQYQPR